MSINEDFRECWVFEFKMADVSGHQMVPNGVSDQETRWKGKYFTLLKHCRQMEQVTNQLITYICLTYNQLTAAVAHGSICVIVLWQRLSKSSKRFSFQLTGAPFIISPDLWSDFRIRNQIYSCIDLRARHTCSPFI